MRLSQRIYLSVLERYLRIKRSQIFNASGTKVAVVSYVLYPKIFNKKYLAISHNNRLMCKLMVDTLIKYGYCVHLYDYADPNILTKNVSLFIGHNVGFHSIAERMPVGCKKVLITTGCSPEFDNKIVAERGEYLEKRLGLRLNYPQLKSEHVNPNGVAADSVHMMGTEFTAKTWPKIYQEKRFGYHNVTLFRPVKKNGIRLKFLFMSNHGALRRGLDIVIDAFSELPYELFICSPCHLEMDFFDFYSSKIKASPNIKYMGFMDTSSSQFAELVKWADFAILPSASEGESSSILNLMSLGLVPVITEAVGIENADDLGFLIQDSTVQDIKDTVVKIAETNPKIIEEKRQLLIQEIESKYTPTAFQSNFEQFITANE